MACQGREAWTECVLWNVSHQGHVCVGVSGRRGQGCWLKSWHGDFGLQLWGRIWACVSDQVVVAVWLLSKGRLRGW